MGCGSCKSNKASVPLSSNIDDTLIQQSVSFLSNQNPNFSQISEPNKPNSQVHPEVSVSPRNPRTDRSNKSEEALTASKEFIKLLQNSRSSAQLQKEYKIYVWTKNRKTLRQVFPNRSFNETLNINSRALEASFTIYTSSIPIIIDCVVYLIEKAEDFKEIFRINQQFKHVWVQAVLTQEKDKKIEELSETLGIQVLRNSKDLLQKVCSEDFRLSNMLKNLFNKIDDNKNGEIDFSELLNNFKSIKDDISLEEIREGLKRIDVDKDGKISFEEFCFWWKKGRQGPLSVSESALGWAKKITINCPETRMLLRKMTLNRQVIEKKMNKKQFLVAVGKDFFPQTQVQVLIGKSGMREKILNSVNFKLGLFSQEAWVSMHSVLKEKISEDRQFFLKKQAEVLIESISGNFIDGKKLRDAIEVDVQVIDSDFFLTFILDTENESMEPINSFLLKLDELLTSPTNDCFELNLSTIEPFYKFFLTGKNFFSNLGSDFKITAIFSHWNKLMSILSSSFPCLGSSHPTFSSFTLGDLRLDLNFETSSKLLESFPFLKTQTPDLSGFLTPRLLHFLNELSPLFKDCLSVFSRCSNLGSSVKIRSADLISRLVQNQD